MTEPLRGVVNVGIRGSVGDWTPFLQPKAPEGAPNVLMIVCRPPDYAAPFVFTGGSIDRVVVDVSGDPFVDHERSKLRAGLCGIDLRPPKGLLVAIAGHLPLAWGPPTIDAATWTGTSPVAAIG